jgi:hypothetical protein
MCCAFLLLIYKKDVLKLVSLVSVKLGKGIRIPNVTNQVVVKNDILLILQQIDLQPSRLTRRLWMSQRS